MTFFAFNMQAQAPCNLITNGDFEQGDVGFISDYSSATSEASFQEGSYWVVSDDNNGCLEVMDHFTCGNNGATNENIMLINGKHGQSADMNNVIWETAQSIAVTTGASYSFDFSAKRFKSAFGSCSNWIALTVEISDDQKVTWVALGSSILVNNGLGECSWMEDGRNSRIRV